MAGTQDEVRLVAKLLSWDEARGELEGDMRLSTLQRLSGLLGGLTREGRSLLAPGISIAAAAVQGCSDRELSRMVRAYSQLREHDDDGAERVTRNIWQTLDAEYPGQPRRGPVDDRLLVHAGQDRAQKIHAAANRGHDMVPTKATDTPLLCSRCQYGLDVCAVIDCDARGVMRPKVEQMQARQAGLVQHPFMPGGEDSTFGASGMWCTVRVEDDQCGRPRSEHVSG